MITIKVPATSANLGPGFDSLGVALQLYATFHVELSDHLRIVGCPPQYANDENLFAKAYRFRMNQLGLRPQAFSLTIDSEIPLARGLGSSAVFIVAGTVAAHVLHDIDFTLPEIVDAAAQFEGHADNVAPAVYGGLCATMIVDGEVLVQRYPIHPSIHFYVIIPDFELLTHLTRVALPEKYPFEDVVRSIAKVPFLLKGLENGDQRQIDASITDDIHQPFRFPLIHQSDDVLAIVKRFGITSTYISGAGPTLGIIVNRPLNEHGIQDQLNGLRHRFELKRVRVDENGLEVIRESA
jgi:homoserine kinase